MTEREQKYYRQGWLHGQAYAPVGRDGAALRVNNVAAALHLSPAAALRHIVDAYRRRLDALPPLDKFPELRGMRECVMAYDRGMADGAGMSDEEVIVTQNYLHTMTNVSRRRSRQPGDLAGSEPGCTLVYFPRSDRGPLIGNNTDDPYRPSNRPEPDWLVANRAGLIVGTVSSGIFDDEVSAETFPAPIFLMLYEMCGTAEEAVELLTRLNLFWGPCNLLVADRHGDSAVIEKSTYRYGVRRGTDGFSATTAMAAESPEFRDYLWQTRRRSLRERNLDHTSCDWAYWKAAEDRSGRLLQLLDEARAEPTGTHLERIVYDHTGEPDQINLDGGKCHPDEETVNWTLRTVVHVIDERCAFYSFAEPPLGAHLTTRYRKDFPAVEWVF